MFAIRTSVKPCDFKCSDRLFCCSLQDTFFYSLVYDPTQKTLLADKGEIRVGPRFQADVPEMLQEGQSERMIYSIIPTRALIYTPLVCVSGLKLFSRKKWLFFAGVILIMEVIVCSVSS